LGKFGGETYMKAIVANFGAGSIFCRFNFNSLTSEHPANLQWILCFWTFTSWCWLYCLYQHFRCDSHFVTETCINFHSGTYWQGSILSL